LRRLNEKIKRNAKADSEEAHLYEFSATDEDALGEKPTTTSKQKTAREEDKGSQGARKNKGGQGSSGKEKQEEEQLIP
jgi:hypothetical protein